MSRIRFALAQVNPIVGDLSGNSAMVIARVREAREQGAAVAVFPEMVLTGYPVEDLAAHDEFIGHAHDAYAVLARLLKEAGLDSMVVIVGGLSPADMAEIGGARAHNSLAVIHGGVVHSTYAKHHLPTYSVFDEERVFVPGRTVLSLNIGGVSTGFLICEDLWRDEGPVAELADRGLDAVVVINASPFDRTKDDVRLPLVTRRAAQMSATVLYVNLVGGQDDLVFDGDSMVVNSQGVLLARAPQFSEGLLFADIVGTATGHLDCDVAHSADAIDSCVAEPQSDVESVWNALVLGTRDYIEKNGFPSVALGLSGGIDSAVVAAIACDAIGPDRVFGVSMPSQWSSEHSQDDARDLANLLGCHYRVEPIANLVRPFDSQLSLSGLAAENIQARARGMILMALSNMDGHLVLTTGNKSEVAVGYCTMYGDTVGGFAPIKDVPKTLVWELARYRNDLARKMGASGAIPESSITKPPSAELRPGQIDQDSLPPYEVLDALLHLLVDERASVDDAVSAGFDRAVVDRISGLVARSEWKRRQGAIGPRITTMAFGRERRLPLTARITTIG